MARRKNKSKKPSGASSRPPEDTVFFLDKSVGAVTLARALRDRGVRVDPHREHFPPGTPDERWLRTVGAYGWIVVTRDQRIRYRKVEQQALLEASVRAFVFTGGSATGEQTAEAVVRALPKILEIVRSERPPFIYAISKSGILKRLR